MSCHAVSTIPEKPNNVNPNRQVSVDTIPQANETLKRLGAVSTRALDVSSNGIPQIDEPVTSAQEYGFAHKPLIPRNPMFHYGRHSCNITEYAAQYYQMSGVTPFSKRHE